MAPVSQELARPDIDLSLVRNLENIEPWDAACPMLAPKDPRFPCCGGRCQARRNFIVLIAISLP